MGAEVLPQPDVSVARQTEALVMPRSVSLSSQLPDETDR